MLKKKKQNDFLGRHYLLLFSHLVAFGQQQDPETLHQLRLEIKKIRSLVAMTYRARAQKQPQHLLAPLKKLFSEAGRLRDRHVQSLHVKNTKRPASAAGANAFNRLAEKLAPQIEKDFEALTRLSQNLEKSSIYDICRDTAARAEKHFTGENGWHEGRKQVKRLVYFYASLPKRLRAGLSLNRHYLRELGEKTGHWHDLELLLTQKNLSAPERKAIAAKKQAAAGEVLALAKNLSVKAFAKSPVR